MSQVVSFADVLDAAESLDLESQAELIAILKRRLAERTRKQMVDAIAEARKEFQAGQSKPMTAAEIMREALS